MFVFEGSFEAGCFDSASLSIRSIGFRGRGKAMPVEISEQSFEIMLTLLLGRRRKPSDSAIEIRHQETKDFSCLIDCSLPIKHRKIRTLH